MNLAFFGNYYASQTLPRHARNSAAASAILSRNAIVSAIGTANSAPSSPNRAESTNASGMRNSPCPRERNEHGARGLADPLQERGRRHVRAVEEEGEHVRRKQCAVQSR